MKQLKIFFAIIVLTVGVILIGVFGFRKPAIAPSANTAPTPAATPVPTLTPAPTATPVPTPTVQEQGKEITLADNNTTITFKVGETFLLKLGESYDWIVLVDNQSVVYRTDNDFFAIGAQGVYRAKEEGRAILTATGNPECRKVIPPCGMPSTLFKVNVVVK